MPKFDPKKSLTFDIRHLLEANIGTREVYSFEAPLEFPEVEEISDLEGEIEIMKIEEGLVVILKNLDLTTQTQCVKCLKKLKIDLEITNKERIFYLKEPEEETDPNDLFFVNRKQNLIDLYDFLRQEIILHFPEIPVCYEGCLGICKVCGKDRNKEQCECKQEVEIENKPLSILKDLIKT